MAKPTPKPIPETQDYSSEVPELESHTPLQTSPDPLDPQDGPFLTSDSPFLAEEEDYRSTGTQGRIKTTGVYADLPLPTPNIRVYTSDAISGQKRPRAGYTYWNNLVKAHRDRVTAYVYREHPILLDPPDDPETKKPIDFKYIDKIDGNQPLQDDLDLLNRYGCGSYKIILNEMATGATGLTNGKGVRKNGGAVIEIFVKGVGGGDYKSNPPNDRRINDVRNLDVSNPNNTSYVSFLRGKGIIPEEINKQKEAEEMATIQAAQSATEQQNRTIETLTSKVVEMAERSQQQPPPQSQVRPEDVSRAVQDGMRSVLLEVRQLIPQTPPPPQKDPMELALQLVTMLRESGNSNSSELAELRAQVAQQNQQQMQVLADQVKTLLESKTTGANSGSPFSGVTDGMKAMKELKDTLEDLGVPMGGPSGPTTNLPAGVPSWLPFIAPIAQQAIGVFGQFLSGRSQQVVTQPQSQPATGVGTIYNPAPANGGLPAPIAPPMPPDFPPQLAKLLDAISYPLFNYLQDSANPDANGDTFAQFFMSGWGDDTFAQIKGYGADGIIQALAAYPPTAQLLSPVPLDRLTKFVTEFTNASPDDGEEDGEIKTPGGPSLVPPVTPIAS